MPKDEVFPPRIAKGTSNSLFGVNRRKLRLAGARRLRLLVRNQTPFRKLLCSVLGGSPTLDGVTQPAQ